MTAGENFIRAMHLLHNSVEDAGMGSGIADKVQVIIPRRAFDILLNDIAKGKLLAPVNLYGRYKEFTFMGMKILADTNGF